MSQEGTFPTFKFGAVEMPHSGSEDARAAVTTGQGGGQAARVPNNRQLRAVAARRLVTPSPATALRVGRTAHESVLREQPGSRVPRFSSRLKPVSDMAREACSSSQRFSGHCVLSRVLLSGWVGAGSLPGWGGGETNAEDRLLPGRKLSPPDFGAGPRAAVPHGAQCWGGRPRSESLFTDALDIS